jgi:predicted nucleotidyltransferase
MTPVWRATWTYSSSSKRSILSVSSGFRTEELSDLLGGREVDLRTPQDLSRYFREKVLASAEVQYARG